LAKGPFWNHAVNLVPTLEFNPQSIQNTASKLHPSHEGIQGKKRYSSSIPPALVGWWIGWLVGWLVDWLVCWLVGEWVVWLIDWWVCGLVGWLIS
jgi:hypothetical protein